MYPLLINIFTNFPWPNISAILISLHSIDIQEGILYAILKNALIATIQTNAFDKTISKKYPCSWELWLSGKNTLVIIVFILNSSMHTSSGNILDYLLAKIFQIFPKSHNMIQEQFFSPSTARAKMGQTKDPNVAFDRR